MRFAITACDRYARVFEEFLAAGWTPVKLFSSHPTNRLSANENVIALARRHGCPVQLTRMAEDDLDDLAQRGCKALIVASYDWRIPHWRNKLQYAVNFHPSPLPLGRGPYPLPRAILERRTSWAMSCHKIEHEFDSGDVLAMEDFGMHEDESHETLNLKLQMAGGRLARKLAPSFAAMWRAAKPQGAGEYWPVFSEAERTLDFRGDVADVLRMLRAFGVLECYAHLNGERIYVRHAHGWPEAHNLAAETVVHTNGTDVVLAVRDGFVALTDWGLLPAAPETNS
ncbi:MAG: formyl transferase [Burkholderiaceae bacterium]|nr:formyl transferase [Burkholderiaceae bacterium]